MKKAIFIICFIQLICSLGLKAQTNYLVMFRYDADGNRTGISWMLLRSDGNTFANDSTYTTNKELSETVGEIDISIYPNPTTGYLVLSSNNCDNNQFLKATLTSFRGETLEERTLSSYQIEFDLSRYSAGIYFLTVECNGDKQLWKIIKK